MTTTDVSLPKVNHTYHVCGERGNAEIRVVRVVHGSRYLQIDAVIIHGVFSGIHARGSGDIIVLRVGDVRWLPRLAKTEECDEK